MSCIANKSLQHSTNSISFKDTGKHKSLKHIREETRNLEWIVILVTASETCVCMQVDCNLHRRKQCLR